MWTRKDRCVCQLLPQRTGSQPLKLSKVIIFHTLVAAIYLSQESSVQTNSIYVMLKGGFTGRCLAPMHLAHGFDDIGTYFKALVCMQCTLHRMFLLANSFPDKRIIKRSLQPLILMSQKFFVSSKSGKDYLKLFLNA